MLFPLLLGMLMGVVMPALLSAFGLIPPLIGGIVVTVMAFVQFMLILVLLRGPAMEFIKAKLS